MNTLSDFHPGNTFSLSLELKELIEDTFKFLYQSNLLKIFLKFVDSHGSYWNNLFFHCWVSGLIFMIFAVIHSVEPLEELSQFITDMIKAEDEDLKVRPQFI